MKRLFALTLAGILFSGFAMAGEFPDGHSYSNISGKLLDPQQNSTNSSLDSVNFGFQSKAVRICLRRDSETIYVRRTYQVSTVFASMDSNTAPSSTSAIFIAGEPATVQAYRAMVITGQASTNGGLPSSTFDPSPVCTVIPLETRGITIHVVSGLATAEVTGFK